MNFYRKIIYKNINEPTNEKYIFERYSFIYSVNFQEQLDFRNFSKLLDRCI